MHSGFVVMNRALSATDKFEIMVAVCNSLKSISFRWTGVQAPKGIKREKRNTGRNKQKERSAMQHCRILAELKLNNTFFTWRTN